MLCRTANALYWMARHIERAENTARLLDVTYRMSLLPYEAIEPGLAWAEPWAVPLVTSGLATAFYECFKHLSAESVLRYMILETSNRSSIYCCLRPTWAVRWTNTSGARCCARCPDSRRTARSTAM